MKEQDTCKEIAAVASTSLRSALGKNQTSAADGETTATWPQIFPKRAGILQINFAVARNVDEEYDGGTSCPPWFPGMSMGDVSGRGISQACLVVQMG